MRIGCPIEAFFLANGPQTCVSLQTKNGRISKDASVFVMSVLTLSSHTSCIQR